MQTYLLARDRKSSIRELAPKILQRLQDISRKDDPLIKTFVEVLNDDPVP